MRPPLFVPGTREVEDVLADMKRLKTHLAVVLDEYGGTAGLVTMEDLLEEIVGPIFDEHDQPDLPAADAGTTLLDGGLPITQFNTEFDASLDDTDYTTIGGLIFGQLGRLPRPGDAVQLGGFTFEVMSMAGRRVETVRLVRPAPPAATPAAVKGARAAPSPGDTR
jgi:CBS domain containing-hemolysin-like protein